MKPNPEFCKKCRYLDLYWVDWSKGRGTMFAKVECRKNDKNHEHGFYRVKSEFMPNILFSQIREQGEFVLNKNTIMPDACPYKLEHLLEAKP